MPTEPELLRKVIEASGMTIKRWAQLVAWRDEKTIHRWLKGESPIPEIALDNIRAIFMRLT